MLSKCSQSRHFIPVCTITVIFIAVCYMRCEGEVMRHSEVIIKTLKSRVSIHVVQKLMRNMQLPTARSWTELELIIKQALHDNPGLVEEFVKAIAVQCIHDFKSVTYFPIAEEDMPEMIRAISLVDVVKGDISEVFPMSLPPEILDKDDGELKPVYKIQDDFGIGFVLSRRREFTLTEEYDREHFSDALLAQFPEHDRIVAIKNYKRQTFDVVYLNVETRNLELRADTTRSDTLLQTVKQLGKSNQDLQAFVNSFFYQRLHRQAIGSPHNLFPLIKKIYQDGSGAIKKLGFSTATNSVKNETMRGGRDLREELFHKFGAQAINHEMSLFEIAIIWHRRDIDLFDSKPELYIPGTYKNSISLAPRCDFAMLSGITGPSDSDFVLRKLIALEK